MQMVLDHLLWSSTCGSSCLVDLAQDTLTLHVLLCELLGVVDASLVIRCRVDVPSLEVLRVDLGGLDTVINDLLIIGVLKLLDVLV